MRSGPKPARLRRRAGRQTAEASPPPSRPQRSTLAGIFECCTRVLALQNKRGRSSVAHVTRRFEEFLQAPLARNIPEAGARRLSRIRSAGAAVVFFAEDESPAGGDVGRLM